MKCFVFLIILFNFLIFSISWSQQNTRVCPDVGRDIALAKDKVGLNSLGKATIDSIVAVLKDYPNCKVLVMSGNHFSSETGQEIAWEDAEAVREYFLSRGISHERLFINYNHIFKKRDVIVRCIEFCEECSTSMPPPAHVLNNGRKKTRLIKSYLKNNDRH